jgi:hypothetical protein
VELDIEPLVMFLGFQMNLCHQWQNERVAVDVTRMTVRVSRST